MTPLASIRESHTSLATPEKPVPQAPRDYYQNRQELLSLVDQDFEGTVEEHFEYYRDPYRSGYAQADGPYLTVSSRREDIEYPAYEDVRHVSHDEQQTLRDLRIAVLRRLRKPLSIDPEAIYRIYLRLPEPRMPYLHFRLRHNLLRVLGTTEKKDSKSMLRYFAVVADVKNSGFPLTREEWNQAIAFASRYVGTSTDVETASALNLWREMEHEAGVQADGVTFNILFDVASKAGNFTLAEMLYQEMNGRGIQFNRYHHVSLIHYFGLRMDGDGVRAAYKEMVEAGEMIDSVVLNCVIASLLRSGEEDAAERIYERMKAAHSETSSLPERNYVTGRVVTKVLMMFAKVARSHPGIRPSLQAASPITPDLSTYRVLVNHYSTKTGNLTKVAQYLDEMKWFKVPLHGAIFLAIFKGFNMHGGAGSEWNDKRLANVWHAFLQALSEGATDLRVDTWMAIWILRAHRKCCSEEAVLRTYEVLASQWDPDHVDTKFMDDFLSDLLSKDRSTVYSDEKAYWKRSKRSSGNDWF